MTCTLGANTLGNLTYAYDLTGRRTSMGGTWARTNLPAALASATYDAANQLTQWGTTTLSYDANGNLTNDGTSTLTWNARNQLASMSGGVTASFQYDAFGRRVNKTIAGVSTEFLHDGSNPVQEQFVGGVNANLLTGGVDEFFSRSDQLGTQTLLTDALSSTWGLTDPSGTILTQYTYEPFGNSTVSGSTFSPFQFTGRENDGTGFYYYRARYYSPALNRFISEDPLALEGGSVNFYEYTYDDPINHADPFGTQALPVPVPAPAPAPVPGPFPFLPMPASELQEDPWGRLYYPSVYPDPFPALPLLPPPAPRPPLPPPNWPGPKWGPVRGPIGPAASPAPAKSPMTGWKSASSGEMAKCEVVSVGPGYCTYQCDDGMTIIDESCDPIIYKPWKKHYRE